MHFWYYGYWFSALICFQNIFLFHLEVGFAGVILKSGGLQIGKITSCYDYVHAKIWFCALCLYWNSMKSLYISSLPVLFLLLFYMFSFSRYFPLWWILSLFFTLHSFALLSYFVCQVIASLFYLYFFSQCCYNLFSGTVFLWFPILWLQSLSTTSHSCILLCTSLSYRYFIRWWYPSYIHIHHCYICQHVLFVFYFLLCLNSHLSL